MTESVPTQSPLVGLDMSSDTAHYVGVLEGTIAALVINECKYRALLELLTGDSWEATKIDVDGKVLMDIAVSSLVKQTGMDTARAKVLVTKRWNQRNQEAPAIVPQAVPVQQVQEPTPAQTQPVTAVDMRSRFEQWKSRQNQEAANVSEPATTEAVTTQADPAPLQATQADVAQPPEAGPE